MADLIKLSVKLRIDIEKKGEWFIATCPFLNVVSQGKSAVQAARRVREEILALIEFCSDRGVLHEMVQHRFSEPGSEQARGRLVEAGELKEERHRWVALELPIAVINELTHAA